MKKKAPALPLPFADFQRMSRTIMTVLGTVDYDVRACCTFFSFMGAHLLNTVHGLDARPVAGAAAFKLIPNSAPLMFGDHDSANNVLQPSDIEFHAWVECQGCAIDLMAPFYREVAAAAVPENSIPRWMFQKQLNQSKSNLAELQEAGDFYLKADSDLTSELLQVYLLFPKNMDMTRACKDLYRAARKSQKAALGLMTQGGGGRKAELCALELTGAW